MFKHIGVFINHVSLLYSCELRFWKQGIISLWFHIIRIRICWRQVDSCMHISDPHIYIQKAGTHGGGFEVEAVISQLNYQVEHATYLSSVNTWLPSLKVLCIFWNSSGRPAFSQFKCHKIRRSVSFMFVRKIYFGAQKLCKGRSGKPYVHNPTPHKLIIRFIAQHPRSVFSGSMPK